MDYKRNLWYSIQQRCYNTRHPLYPRYGGRGIGCWWKDRDNFIQWIENNLGERPEGYSLDRVNNNKGYEPDNLRWATSQQQNDNRRQPACVPGASGWRWVTKHKRRWKGQIKHQGEKYTTRLYLNPADAYLQVLCLRSLLIR